MACHIFISIHEFYLYTHMYSSQEEFIPHRMRDDIKVAQPARLPRAQPDCLAMTLHCGGEGLSVGSIRCRATTAAAAATAATAKPQEHALQ